MIAIYSREKALSSNLTEAPGALFSSVLGSFSHGVFHGKGAADLIDANQLGRRNLSPDQASLLRGRRYNRVKKSEGAPKGNKNRNQLHQNDVVETSTAEKLAKQHGVSKATIVNFDGVYLEPSTHRSNFGKTGTGLGWAWGRFGLTGVPACRKPLKSSCFPSKNRMCDGAANDGAHGDFMATGGGLAVSDGIGLSYIQFKNAKGPQKPPKVPNFCALFQVFQQPARKWHTFVYFLALLLIVATAWRCPR